MNIKIYIQARLSSKRLPGKVLMEVFPGMAVVELIYKRLSLNPKWREHVKVVTSDDKTDDELAHFLEQKNIPYFRGPLLDVLRRFYLAAEKDKADLIVRVTADCPLIDPYIVEEVINRHVENIKSVDYCSNVRPRSFPDGVDVETFTREALKQALDIAKEQFDREHVTPYIFKNRKKVNLFYPIDLSKIRVTLDTAEDLEIIKNVYTKSEGNPYVLFPEWIKWTKEYSQLGNLFYLRRTTFKDAKTIFNWQISPGMRDHFRNTKSFTYEEHCKWLESKLDFKSKAFLYIACDNDLEVGFIRIEQNSNLEWEVSILIDLKMQGKGLGKKSLNFIRQLHPEKTLIAEVKKENTNSVKVFLSCGYELKNGLYYNYPINTSNGAS